MINKELGRKMFDLTVRVEHMFWIGGMCDATSDFTDFVEDDLHECREILERFPWLKGAVDSEDVLADFGFHGVDGFIVQLATPVPSNFTPDGKSYSFSWGSYYLKHFFCESLEEIVEVAEKWRKEKHEFVFEREQKKRLKAAGGIGRDGETDYDA